MKTRRGVKDAVLDVLSILVGSALVAVALVVFTIPNAIAPGGVSGLATALAHITPVTVGVWTLLLNVPIIAVAWRKLGLGPITKTVLSTVLLSLLIDVLTPLLAPYTNNPLLAAVAGGVLSGAGMGLIFLRGASTGGTDLISLLLNRVFPGLSIGFLLLLVDSCVVLFAVCVFQDIEVALYSVVAIYATTKMVDAILQGVDHAKVIYAVTDCGEAVRQKLTEELGLGVTVMDARGGYTRAGKQVLMLVVRRGAFIEALNTVKSVDPEVFLFVTNAAEVHGEGFKM